MIPNTPHYPVELDVQYARIHLGVAWPAVRPGWAVVVGEHRTGYIAGLPRLDVLDETQDARLWHVVDKAWALWAYYRPESSWSDTRHVAGMQFVAERVQRDAAAPGGRRPGPEATLRRFSLEPSFLCPLDSPCAYLLPTLDRALETGRLVVPAASQLRGELLVPPRHEDPAKLLLADYPAITALGYAVLGLEYSRPGLQRPDADASLRRIYD